jgi:hypothetical protein
LKRGEVWNDKVYITSLFCVVVISSRIGIDSPLFYLSWKQLFSLGGVVVCVVVYQKNLCWWFPMLMIRVIRQSYEESTNVDQFSARGTSSCHLQRISGMLYLTRSLILFTCSSTDYIFFLVLVESSSRNLYVIA